MIQFWVDYNNNLDGSEKFRVFVSYVCQYYLMCIFKLSIICILLLLLL